MRLTLYACLFLAGCAPAWGQPAAPADRLGEALGLAGFTRADLGYRPKGYWSRYPNPQQMAGKLPFYDDLFAEPLRIYEYARLMGMAAGDYLDPRGLAEKGDALYQLVYCLGVDRRISGFRPYSANLDTLADPRAPLRQAIETVYARTGTELAPMVFGARREERREELDAQIAGLDTALQRLLAILVLNVLDAYQWRQQALRRVAPDDLHRVFQIRDLSRIVDERVYHPEMDDVARELDEQSLYYAGLKAVQAADHARRRFAQLARDPARDLRGAHFDFETPLGRVVLAGSGDDVHRYADAAVLVDLGGQDRYLGPVGATPSLDVPISVAIDCAGDDTYEYAGDAPAQGAGILGAGVLIDQAGNDTYQARRYAQGLGFFGVGLLFDQEGDDRYSLEQSGQGAGYFGVGCHFDGSGDDRFHLYGDGQGFGGVGGVGVLANHSGDDHYVVEPLAEIAGRPDFHSQGRIAYSTAQGAGVGRRGDGSDGHNWAGGLGVLLDLSGRDTYEAGNFSMGFGYMYGTGLLYDGGGDDQYRSVYFTQASGAHFSIGALIDDSGDDQHVLYDTGGAGLAFGWDFAVALLVDKGGDDRYQARDNSLGRADLRANALFIDLGGDDQYVFPPQAGGLGIAAFQAQFRTPGYTAGPYPYYASSFALLLDIGGRDQYLDYDPGTDATTPSPAYGNDRVWQQPAPGAPEYGYRNFGVGMDVPDGAVPELSIFDRPVGQ